MKRKYRNTGLAVLLAALLMLTACGSQTIDDFATNNGYDNKAEGVQEGSDIGKE